MLKSKFVKNVLFGFGGQAVILILGIFVPRIMIKSYGSDVNGLLNTVTQIFTYMALLEAGIGQSARNALMKPLSQQNKPEISKIITVASKYFKRFTIYYGIGVILVALICPFIIKTEVNKLTIGAVFLLEGFSGVISFSQVETISVVLSADGRNYVNNGINVINRTISYITKIIMASFGVNIVLLEVVYFLITIGKVAFYKKYFNNRYDWVDYSCSTNSQKLPDRNSYVLTEIAWTIFSSTDLIVLSIFVSTKLSSVYAVYNLVFNSINVLLNAVYSSVSYTLGQNYHKDRKRYLFLHDGFSSIFLGGMTCMMCTAFIMVLPFIRLYTKDVTDVNYIYTSLPIMFSLVQLLSWSRYVTGNLSGVAGYAKITSRISIIEAVLNIVCSVILVQLYGIEGVLFATVIALPVKVVFLTWLSEAKILKRSPFKYLMILLSNYAVFGCTVFISRFIDLNIESYLHLFIYGGIVFAACIIVCGVVNTIVNPELLQVIKEVKGRKQNG